MKSILWGLALLLVSSSSMFAQSIPIQPMMYDHLCSKEHRNPIQTVPPLEWGMPLEVFQAYVAADSLCRYEGLPDPYGYEEIEELLLSKMSCSDFDSLYKYIYAVLDYNPYLAYSYLKVANNLNTDYLIKPIWMFKDIAKYAYWNSCDRIKECFTFASGIYHIKVLNVANDTRYKTAAQIKTQELVCMDVEVLYSFKGAKLANKVYNVETGDSLYSMKVSYAKDWYMQAVSSGDVVVTTRQAGDTARYQNTQFGGFHDPQAGDEYILFAEIYMEPRRDSTGMPYNVFPQIRYQIDGGMFKIDNDEVVDTGGFFKIGNNISLATFYSYVEAYILTNFMFIN